jgi:thiamine monophosphate kinase
MNDSWTGQSRPRRIERRGDQLVFTGPAGDGSHATIVWQRERPE